MLDIVTNNGNAGRVTYQIAKVSRPLNSVSEICDAGNRIVFGRNGGVIYHIESGKETYFTMSNGIYILDCLVKPMDRSNPDFTRLGR